MAETDPCSETKPEGRGELTLMALLTIKTGDGKQRSVETAGLRRALMFARNGTPPQCRWVHIIKLLHIMKQKNEWFLQMVAMVSQSKERLF